MLMPSIFNNNLFDDDWFGFPFYGYADKAENRAEKKLYGHHANNLMKTDIKEMRLIFQGSRKMKLLQN